MEVTSAFEDEERRKERDAVSIRLPYGDRKRSEVELSGQTGSGPRNAGPDSGNGGFSAGDPRRLMSLKKLALAAMVAGGVQYGWALQLSLLTPYVQTLGISHALSSLMWLCGPVAGFVVQPCVGFWSDRCYSKFGRRRPFILVGCLLIAVAVTIIGYASDIGYTLGDTKESCSTYRGPRWRAALIFVIGFWFLDLANNTVQGPARALLADLAGADRCNAANAIFCSWMAFGNILGYSSGASGKWHRWFPFLVTNACCEACANLKGAFLVAVVFLLLCTVVTLVFAKEVPLVAPSRLAGSGDGHKSLAGNSENSSTVYSKVNEAGNDGGQTTGFLSIFKSFNHLPPGMPSVLLVTAVTWLSWFPFILFDTDFMGREVYHGDPNGTPAEVDAFNRGVREGAFGLLLNSVVLGVTSFLIEPMCQRVGARIVWVIGNFTVFICMAATAVIGWLSVKDYSKGIQHVIGPNGDFRTAALVLFAILGFPLAILFSVPFSVTAQLAAIEGRGQGLCTGVLNIAIVVPQVIIALGAGPWDALFGKGNLPAFVLAAVFAFLCGFLGMFILPKLSKSTYKASGLTGFH